MVQGGSGGGTYFGGGNGTLRAGSGATAVMIGFAGDKMYSNAAAGDIFGAYPGGDILMDGSRSTGNDVFFGSTGTRTMTFIRGSGNDVMGLGQGVNKVTLGSGSSTVFAGGANSVTTVTAGSGSAALAMGRASEVVNIAAGPASRSITLFNFAAGPNKTRPLNLGDNPKFLLQTPAATALSPSDDRIQQPTPVLNGARTNTLKITRRHRPR